MLVITCSVAHKFLDDVELGNDAIRSAVVEFMPYSFAAVNAQSKRFLEVLVCDGTICTESACALATSWRAACLACCQSFTLLQADIRLSTSLRSLQVEKRYNYTTPKTFLELIKLYKSVLARKRNQVQEAIDRLDTVNSCACNKPHCLLP